MAPVDSAPDTPAPPPPEELVLAGEFPGATRDQWAALVDGVLRKSGRIGADAEPGAGVDKLVRRTPEGIPVAPLYTQADVADLPPVGVPGRPPYVRGGTADGPAPDGWDVRQRHEGPDVRDEAVLADLENGVTSIWLAAGDGAEPSRAARVLDGVLLDLAPVALDTGGADTGAAAAYLDLAGGLADPAALLGTLGLDPIGLRARTASARTSPRSCRWRSAWRPSTRWCGRSSSTRSRCTPRAAPTRRSWASRIGGGRGVPAGAHRRRARRRDRGPAAGVPLRRHRRAVPHDREAARRPSAVGAGAGGLRRARGGRPAPARRLRRRRCSPGATRT